MKSQESTLPQTREIESFVERLNDSWLNDKLENMDMFFHKQVVMLQPGTNKKVIGREAMIDSYREFVESSEVSDFRTKDLAIDVFEDTAVVFYTFRIKYRVETTNYDEDGSETLVLHRHNDRWLIVWRMQMPGF
jgi:ketosteroid isomerase-like protein